MKNLKFALLLVLPFCFNSCSNENNNPIEASVISEKNAIQYDTNTARQLYLEVLNAKDQHNTYSNLDSKSKSLVWQGKFDDFISNSTLTNVQIDIVQKIKSKLTESFFQSINSNFNSEEIKSLEFEAMQKLGNLRAISLLYTMENFYNESGNGQKCFWCDNELVTIDGPCFSININGNWLYVEPITTKKVRFWITVGEWETIQPCTQP